MAANRRRASGFPSASAIRSAIGMLASCQGAPSPSLSSALAAKSGAPSSATAPAFASSDNRPAKNPLSQARCSCEKGAELRDHGLRRVYPARSRRRGRSGNIRLHAHRPVPAAMTPTMALRAVTSWRREKARKVSSAPERCCKYAARMRSIRRGQSSLLILR